MTLRTCALLLSALWLTAAFGEAGTLKVTSFPSGARVTVDGVNTGKVTPMNIALTDGDHVVTVDIPDSGWNPDTRVVTVVPGNNDLSVTLLPTLTQGPRGPQGPAGAAAIVRGAGSGECPTGGIVVTSGDGAVSLPVCNGARGEMGATGATGAQGVPGPSGPPGGAPVVDPRTLARLAGNLDVDISAAGSPNQFGISPIYVDIDTITETLPNGQVRYTPGAIHLAPFALVARRDDERKALEDWFGRVSDGRDARRNVALRLLSRDGRENAFFVELGSCVPTALDTTFDVTFAFDILLTSVTRAVVECAGVSGLTLTGGKDPGYNSPARGLAALFGAPDELQPIAEFSGGGAHVVAGQIIIDPVRMRAGSVNDSLFPNGSTYSVRGLGDWMKASLGLATPAATDKLQNIDLLGEQTDGSLAGLAHFQDVFLTSMILIDSTQALGTAQDAPIPVTFALVMKPNGRQ